MLRVVRSTAIAEGAEAAASGAEWFMDYRNADGSKAEMCGNGTRVFAKYLLQTGLAGIDGGLRIGTRAGVKTLNRHRQRVMEGKSDAVRLDLGSRRTNKKK